MWKLSHVGLWCLATSVYFFPVPLSAGCLISDAAPGTQGRFKVHLDAACTPAEREAHAVDADALLTALKRGETVDLNGVLIRGDVVLDTLPVVTAPPADAAGLARRCRSVHRRRFRRSTPARSWRYRTAATTPAPSA